MRTGIEKKGKNLIMTRCSTCLAGVQTLLLLLLLGEEVDKLGQQDNVEGGVEGQRGEARAGGALLDELEEEEHEAGNAGHELDDLKERDVAAPPRLARCLARAGVTARACGCCPRSHCCAGSERGSDGVVPVHGDVYKGAVEVGWRGGGNRRVHTSICTHTFENIQTNKVGYALAGERT